MGCLIQPIPEGISYNLNFEINKNITYISQEVTGAGSVERKDTLLESVLRRERRSVSGASRQDTESQIVLNLVRKVYCVNVVCVLYVVRVLCVHCVLCVQCTVKSFVPVWYSNKLPEYCSSAV